MLLPGAPAAGVRPLGAPIAAISAVPMTGLPSISHMHVCALRCITHVQSRRCASAPLCLLLQREKAKVDAANRALRRLQKRLRDEEFKAFRGDETVDEGGVAAAGLGGSSGSASGRGTRPREPRGGEPRDGGVL